MLGALATRVRTAALLPACAAAIIAAARPGFSRAASGRGSHRPPGKRRSAPNQRSGCRAARCLLRGASHARGERSALRQRRPATGVLPAHNRKQRAARRAPRTAPGEAQRVSSGLLRARAQPVAALPPPLLRHFSCPTYDKNAQEPRAPRRFARPAPARLLPAQACRTPSTAADGLLRRPAMACVRLAPLAPLVARPPRTRARRSVGAAHAAHAAAADPLLLRVARGEGALAGCATCWSAAL